MGDEMDLGTVAIVLILSYAGACILVLTIGLLLWVLRSLLWDFCRPQSRSTFLEEFSALDAPPRRTDLQDNANLRVDTYALESIDEGGVVRSRDSYESSLSSPPPSQSYHPGSLPAWDDDDSESLSVIDP